MPKPLGVPNEWGLYRAEKGGHRFCLGSNKREAERGKLLLEQLWEQQRELDSWTPLTIGMAKSFARGEKYRLDSDNQHEFVSFQCDFPMVSFEAPWAVEEAKEQVAGGLEAKAQLYRYSTTGQRLFQALAAYQDCIKKEYLDGDGHVTDNGKMRLNQCKQLLTYLPDGCDRRFAG